MYPFIAGRFVGMLLFVSMILIAYYYMRRGKPPYIRRVAAIDAIDEGVGRATELGGTVIVSPGIAQNGMDDWTVAGLSVLSYVAGLAARNDLKLLVPLGGSDQSYAMVEIARDIVEGQYRLAGKPETFTIDNMPFLSGRQFAWATAYVGMILREKPALDVMVGTQWATAVYMSEVASNAGCMQISGTDYLSNVACLATTSDYIMIGEEQVAAGAYLSKDPVQLSSIRTQDLIKGLIIVLLIVGTIIVSFGSTIISQIFAL
jgi:hypothetical protein